MVCFSLWTPRKSMMRTQVNALISAVNGDSICSSLFPLKSKTTKDVNLDRQSGRRVNRFPDKLRAFRLPERHSMDGRIRFANGLISCEPYANQEMESTNSGLHQYKYHSALLPRTMGWLRSKFCNTRTSSWVSIVTLDKLILGLLLTSKCLRWFISFSHAGTLECIRKYEPCKAGM